MEQNSGWLFGRERFTAVPIALWSNDRLDDAFTARLRRIFADARAEEVTFHNPLQDKPFTQTVYLAKKQAVPRRT